jgi:hypothetical protein
MNKFNPLSALLSSASAFAMPMPSFDGEGEPAGTPAPSPAPAPAPEPDAGDVKPFLSEGDEGNAEGESGEEKPSGETEGEEGEGSAEDEAAAAKAEEERRAGLSDEEREAEDAKKKADEEAAAGAPEEYADFEMPEGVVLDAEATDQLKAFGKEHNLPQAEVQKLASLGAQLQQNWTEAIIKDYVDKRTAWREAAQNDTEFGGDKFKENVALGKAAIEEFGSPALKTYLDESGLGDHPEFLRFAINVGKANSEHNFVKSGRPAKEQPFYDHPTSKGN